MHPNLRFKIYTSRKHCGRQRVLKFGEVFMQLSRLGNSKEAANDEMCKSIAAITVTSLPAAIRALSRCVTGLIC